jgi:phage FluMu protein Com
MGRFLGFQDEFVDNEGDQRGISLTKDYFCGDCNHYMAEINGHEYRCRHCGQVFIER